MAKTHIIALLLAAGASRRFGSDDKLLARLHSKPLVQHAADALRAVPFDARLAVISSPRVAALLPDFDHILVSPGAPQSDSLRAGIVRATALGASQAVVTLGDMPRVPAELIGKIAAQKDAACAGDGTRRMPPAGFPAALFPTLLEMTGDRGAGPLLATLPESAVIHTAPETLTDIDRPEDLAELQKNA